MRRFESRYKKNTAPPESYVNIGATYLTESAKLYRRFLMFGFVLLMAHILDLKPQKYQGFGLSVDVKDQKIIYGFLAIIVVYEFLMAIYYEIIGTNITKFDWTERIKQNLYNSIKKSYPNLNYAKLHTNTEIVFAVVMSCILPFFLAIASVGFIALIVACFDIYNFINIIITMQTPRIVEFLGL